jgi:predicted DNA-binding transcriptional regulator YafY
MKNKLAKLIEVLPWLCANPGISADVAAKHFQITKSELIQLLQLAVVTGPGQGGGELVDIDFEDEESLFVSDAKGLQRPIQLSGQQAIQVIAGLHYLLQLPGLVNREDLVSLITKLQNSFRIDNSPIEVMDDPRLKEISEVLSKAISAQSNVKIDYANVNTGAISAREIEPKEIVINDDQFFLTAWCLKSEDYRLFRLDRIMNIQDSKTTQQLRSSASPLSSKGPIEVTLICSKRMTLEFDPEIVLSKRIVQDDLIELVIGVHDLNWIAGEILASAGEIRGQSPRELLQLVNERIDNWHILNKSA